MFSVIIFMLGFYLTLDPIFNESKESMDFIGRTIISITFLFLGFSGITKVLLIYQTKKKISGIKIYNK